MAFGFAHVGINFTSAYNATINVCAADGQWRNLIYFVSEENKGSYIDMCDHFG